MKRLKFRLAFAVGLMATVVLAAAQLPPALPVAASAMSAVVVQPPPAPQKNGLVVVPAPTIPGGKVVLVPRDQLRAGPGTKTARLHPDTRKAMASNAIPVPASWDWTKNTTVKLPMYGNDQYGDCYYVTLVKMFILYQFNVAGSQLTFDQAALVRRYLQLSGGDNGLSDSDVFPELKKGVIGPNGPHKALDVMVVPATDKAALDLTGWAFGPHMFTFTVYSNFMDGAKPGALFTGSSGRQLGGHAIPLSGKTPDGYRQAETWAVQPSIRVSDSWIASVDPEFIAVFSLEWFDMKGYAPNGQHYQTLAALWNSMGGKVDPVGPFPAPSPTPPVPPIPTPPTPPVPPTPPAPVVGFTGTLTYVNGVLVAATPGPAPKPGLQAELEAAGVSPAIILDLLKLVADVKAKAGFAVILADVMKIIEDLHTTAMRLPRGAEYALAA